MDFFVCFHWKIEKKYQNRLVKKQKLRYGILG